MAFAHCWSPYCDLAIQSTTLDNRSFHVKVGPFKSLTHYRNEIRPPGAGWQVIFFLLHCTHFITEANSYNTLPVDQFAEEEFKLNLSICKCVAIAIVISQNPLIAHKDYYIYIHTCGLMGYPSSLEVPLIFSAYLGYLLANMSINCSLFLESS